MNNNHILLTGTHTKILIHQGLWLETAEDAVQVDFVQLFNKFDF